MATWPAALPQAPLADGYNEKLPDNLLRSEMDTGPAKVRRKTTSNVKPVTCAFLLTGTQLALLEDFIGTDIIQGATQFVFPHPRVASTVNARYIPPMQIEAAGPNSNLSDQLFRVTLNLEFMP